MRRTQRYERLVLLCALLATAALPSAARAAYAEVDRPAAQTATLAARRAQPAPPPLDAPRAVGRRAATTPPPRTSPPRRPVPFYVLFCSLLR